MSPRHIPALDGLRGLAILLVLLFHYGISLAPVDSLGPFALGWSGVDLFFVLSGFLLGGILLDGTSLRSFYIRRACRILPLYFAFIALFFTAAAFFDYPRIFGDAFSPISYFSFTQTIPMAMENRFGAGPLGMTWSLAVEEQFYLILPAMVLFTPRRWLPLVLLVLSAASIAIRFAIHDTHPIGAYVLLPCRWDSLFAGVLGAWLVRKTTLRQSWLWLSLAVSGIGIFCLARLGNDSSGMKVIGYTVFAAFYLSLLLLSISNSLVSRVFCLRPLRWLGHVSYGVYLIHGGSIIVLAGMPTNFYAMMALSLLVTLGLAALSRRYFEEPFLRLGKRLSRVNSPRSEQPERALQITSRCC